jgi:hypothetical protein
LHDDQNTSKRRLVPQQSEAEVSADAWLKAIESRPEPSASLVDIETPMRAYEALQLAGVHLEDLEPDLRAAANGDGIKREDRIDRQAMRISLSDPNGSFPHPSEKLRLLYRIIKRVVRMS